MHGLGGQHTVIEKMFLYPVADPDAKFFILKTLLPDPLRVATGVAVASRKGAGAVFPNIPERVLRIPDKKAESIPAVPIADAVPIVRAEILSPGTDRCVVVAAVKDHQHVVD